MEEVKCYTINTDEGTFRVYRHKDYDMWFKTVLDLWEVGRRWREIDTEYAKALNLYDHIK